MLTVTVEKAENGYMVKVSDGRIFIAETIYSYGMAVSVSNVLKEIFEPKDKE
jgi:hypothetical protein